jgi:prepilin-type N-terminal cleavage/methylation domain-containing protein
MHREDGFTLIELMSVIALSLILLTLSAGSMRSYWLNQQLSGAAGEVRSQLRQLQERTVSESHPNVYGVRFRVGTSSWGVLDYNPTITASHPAATCTDTPMTFSSSVKVSVASFTVPSGSEAANIVNLCKSSIPGAGSDQMMLFFARGTATPGSVSLTHPLVGRSKTLTVSAITGRVDGP